MNARADTLSGGQTLELPELDPSAPGAAPPAVAPARNPVHAVKARLQVCVGAVTLSIGELMAAEERQVLVLDRAIDQPVDILLEGSVVARGQLVAVGEQFAVCITQLPVALTP